MRPPWLNRGQSSIISLGITTALPPCFPSPSHPTVFSCSRTQETRARSRGAAEDYPSWDMANRELVALACGVSLISRRSRKVQESPGGPRKQWSPIRRAVGLVRNSCCAANNQVMSIATATTKWVLGHIPLRRAPQQQSEVAGGVEVVLLGRSHHRTLPSLNRGSGCGNELADGRRSGIYDSTVDFLAGFGMDVIRYNGPSRIIVASWVGTVVCSFSDSGEIQWIYAEEFFGQLFIQWVTKKTAKNFLSIDASHSTMAFCERPRISLQRPMKPPDKHSMPPHPMFHPHGRAGDRIYQV